MNQNPKHIQALKEGKAPLEHLLGGKVDAAEARVLAHGAGKYGVRNWRKDPILLKTYVAAIRRHLNAWADGQDLDPDSGESHLAHIRACCAVALDAQHQGTAQDDRLFMESKGSPVTATEIMEAQLDFGPPPVDDVLRTVLEVATQGYPGSPRNLDGSPVGFETATLEPGPRELGGRRPSLVEKTGE